MVLHAEIYCDYERKARPHKPSTMTNSPTKIWTTTFAFLTSSSVLFAYLFEWDRYQIITVSGIRGLSLLDKALVFWLLVAKSLVFFVPVLLICSVLIAFRWRRTAILVLNCSSIGIFYWLATDLVSVSVTGYHAWDYLPDLRYIHWQWFAERLTAEALIVFGTFVAAALVLFIFAQWVTSRLGRRFPWMRSFQATVALMTAFIVIVVGIVPALILFSDRNLLGRILPVAPLPASMIEFVQSFIERPSGRVGFAHADQKPSDALNFPVDAKDELLAMKFAQEAAQPGPADFSAVVERSNLPNVILIIFESFRHSSISPELMRELDKWSEQGLQLQRHYSGSNCSHLGLFHLFYGRSSLGYHQTLDRNIPPQLFESLRRSGYGITLLTAGEIKAFRRLDEFINEKYCDRILIEGEFKVNGEKDWPDSDRRKLTRLKSIINAPHDQPQFVFFYLLSTFYRYAFPAEFEIFKESPGFWQFFSPWKQLQSRLNRYANSLLFLEHELMDVLRSIDLKHNIVVITGDHGESMGEDGVCRHTTRMSEIQMRVPCVIVGAGVDQRKIPTATVHTDILPTLLHVLANKNVAIRNCQGRDLIAERSPADEVVLAPANGSEWEGLLIVRRSKRIAFITQTFSEVPSVEFAGLVDEAGQYKWKVGDTGRVPPASEMKR